MASNVKSADDSEIISQSTDLDAIDSLLDRFKESSNKLNHNNYDLIQQAIISGNNAALSYLLAKNYKPSTLRPTCNDYLHLACRLGRTTMISHLMEARPDDFYLKGRVCHPNPCFHSSDTSMFVGGQLPLDIVVAAKDGDSLRALLHSVPASKCNKLLPAAFLCDLDHPSALALLLKTSVPYEDLKSAYKQALMKKRHQCLEILFSAGYKDVVVRGMNSYHILYQYSSGYNRHISRHEGLCASTQVLLKHGVDVCAYRPAGSYPLYSLIDLIMKDVSAYGDEYVSEAVSGHELLSCLKLLLKQGVRIDLDEVHVSLNKQEDERVAFGRDLHCSVFDVISSNANTTTSVNLAASEVILECVTILLAHRASHSLKPSYMSGILRLLAHARRSKSTQKNLEKVVYEYLWNGLNSSRALHQSYGVNCQYHSLYLINQYMESLCSERQSTLPETLNGNPAVRWLVNTMNYNSICTSNQINLRLLSKASKPQDVLTPSLFKFVTSPPLLRLKTLAARIVWFSIERERSRLESLPIPKHMQLNFIDIIIKEI